MQINRESLTTGIESWTAHRVDVLNNAVAYTLDALKGQIDDHTIVHPGHHATEAQPENLVNIIAEPTPAVTTLELAPNNIDTSTPESRADAARRQIEAIQGSGQPVPIITNPVIEATAPVVQNVEALKPVVSLNEYRDEVAAEPIAPPKTEPITSFADYLKSQQQQGLKDAA